MTVYILLKYSLIIVIAGDLNEVNNDLNIVIKNSIIIYHLELKR